MNPFVINVWSVRDKTYKLLQTTLYVSILVQIKDLGIGLRQRFVLLPLEDELIICAEYIYTDN